MWNAKNQAVLLPLRFVKVSVTRLPYKGKVRERGKKKRLVAKIEASTLL